MICKYELSVLHLRLGSFMAENYTYNKLAPIGKFDIHENSTPYNIVFFIKLLKK